MGYLDRLKIAAVVTAISIGILMVLDMFFSFDLVNILFDPWFVIPVFVVAYLVAPVIGKYIVYKR